MSKVYVSIMGTSAVLENINLSNATLQRKISAELQYAGIECQAEAKKACPVGTPESTHKKGYAGGRLRASIMYKKLDDFTYTVSTNVLYAPYVEFGTKKMKARPFLYPAYAIAKQHLLENLRNV
jgi:HK97 gp10 family phage protein